MLRRPAAALTTCAIALTTMLGTPAPSGAEPVSAPAFLPVVDAFAGTPTSQRGITAAMAGDGAVVVADVHPSTAGAVEVQARRPGGSFGPVTTLQPAAAGVNPGQVEVHGGPDGTLAIVWQSGVGGARASLLPPEATTWTPPVDLGGPVPTGAGAVDVSGRLWVVEQVGAGGAMTQVEVVAPGDVVSSVALSAPPGVLNSPAIEVGPDGVGRVAFRAFTTGTGSEGSACTNKHSLAYSDVDAGSATATVEELTAVTSSGTMTGGRCAATTGEFLREPDIVVTADGETTVTFGTAQVAPPSATEIRALHRSADGTWPADPETVLACICLAGTAVPVGDRVVQVVQRYPAGSALPDQGLVVREPDGSWSTFQQLNGDAFGSQVAAAGSVDGGAVFGFQELQSPTRMQVHTMDAAGVLSPNTHNIDDNGTGAMTAAGTDRDGNAVLTFTAAGADGTLVGKVLPIDATGPRLTEHSIPRTAERGEPMTATATPVDVWSPSSTPPSWEFDDGGVATGRSVSHVFLTTGTHTVTVRAVDALGRGSSATSTVTVVDTVAPRFTRRPKVRPSPARHRSHATLRLATSEPVALKAVLTRLGPGRHHLRKVVEASLPSAHQQKVRLPRLAPGAWKVVVTVTDVVGHTSAVRIRVKVV